MTYLYLLRTYGRVDKQGGYLIEAIDCSLRIWPIIIHSSFNGMLKLLTIEHAVHGRPALKYILERFWKGSVDKLV